MDIELRNKLKEYCIPLMPLPKPLQNVDYEKLIHIFEQNSSKLKKLSYKHTIKGTKKSIDQFFYEMYFSYHEFNYLFKDMIPLKCLGYMYVYISPNYEIPIHKDTGYAKTKLGFFLKGNAPIRFYQNEHSSSFLGEYNYVSPCCINVLNYHNVSNNHLERLTFFLQFEEDYKEVYKKVTNIYS